MEEFDDMTMEEYAMEDMQTEAITAFVTAASKSASKLTKLIVENNRVNGEKMTTDDIYRTYSESFIVAMSTIANVEE